MGHGQYFVSPYHAPARLARSLALLCVVWNPPGVHRSPTKVLRSIPGVVFLSGRSLNIHSGEGMHRPKAKDHGCCGSKIEAPARGQTSARALCSPFFLGAALETKVDGWIQARSAGGSCSNHEQYVCPDIRSPFWVVSKGSPKRIPTRIVKTRSIASCLLHRCQLRQLLTNP